MRNCIFCGGGPVTKEDAWPVWLVEQVGRSRLIASMTGPNARPAYRTDRIEQRAGCTCQQCNNGWMSDLEQLTKPILGPMVDGKALTLSGLQQAILAAWMLKTLMIFDWVMGENYWRDDERHLMSRRQPGQALAGSSTYAAQYVGTYTALAYPRHQTVRRLGGEDTGIPIFSGILIAGQAMLWLQTNRYKETTGRDNVLWPPKHFDRLISLGGPESAAISWPPTKSLDDSALTEFLGGEHVS
jgi:hypothetical protein